MLTEDKNERLRGFVITDKERNMAIGINITTPTRPIDIAIGTDHFTDENIRRWAAGDLTDIDFATGQASLIIEYLSRIIEDFSHAHQRAD